MTASAGGPEPLDDDALEFATGSGSVQLCSTPSSCKAPTNPGGTVNQTITFTSTISTNVTT